MTEATLDATEVAYRARALAQAHPLSRVAKRYLDRVVAEQRTSQPLPEIGIWAGAAMLNGYCVRRVEEGAAGLAPREPERPSEPVGDEGALLDQLEEAVSLIAAKVRTGDTESSLIDDDARTVDTLDRIVTSEVERRLDHWRDTVDDKAWDELSEYITWWVVKGYALRAAEVLGWQGDAVRAAEVLGRQGDAAPEPGTPEPGAPEDASPGDGA
ncbi:MAG: hypothetical protein ACRDWV_09365 [Acidimicrobiales bacterium]